MSEQSINNIVAKLAYLHMHSLILNPTENIPFEMKYDIDFLEGLYIHDTYKGIDAKVHFGGREIFFEEMTSLYKHWEIMLNAKASTFKLYSGLHAHIILFMSIASIGDKVLLLSEQAGGHYATTKILNRLGMKTKHFVTDDLNMHIDVEKTKVLINTWEPQFIFVDRSDGLYYEDFKWLKEFPNCYKIFDASQYLTHILANDYVNPFEMGADLILTSLHKNYPGPQHAAFFTRKIDETWQEIKSGISLYVSNSHPREILRTVLTCPSILLIKDYSKKMLENSRVLENTLITHDVPIIERSDRYPPTQQIWIPSQNQEKGYAFFQRLEEIGFLASFRELPYQKGFGLRLGTAAATRQNLTPEVAKEVGQIISTVYHEKTVTKMTAAKAKKCILRLIHFTKTYTSTVE